MRYMVLDSFIINILCSVISIAGRKENKGIRTTGDGGYADPSGLQPKAARPALAPICADSAGVHTNANKITSQCTEHPGWQC